MDVKPCWAYQQCVKWGFIDKCIYAPDGIEIWDGFEHHWDVLPQVHPNKKVAVMIQREYTEWHFQEWNKVWETRCSHKSKSDFCILFNSDEQRENAGKYGWFGILIDSPFYPCRKTDEPDWITYLRLQNIRKIRILKRQIADLDQNESFLEKNIPAWKYNGNAIISCFWNLETTRIWILENVEHNWDILPYFKPGIDILFIIMSWHMTQWNFENAANSMKKQNPGFSLSNIIFLANAREYIPMAHSAGMKAIYVNQNAFIDENLFHIIPNKPRKYECIVNSRPEWWKRTILIKDVPNVAIINGFVFNEEQVINLDTWVHPIWTNRNRISAEEVCIKLNESQMGGIFSEEEGACFSSSEYLLCGLPVLTTKSRGGRDVWYTPDNSIIVEDNTEKVYEGWLQLKKMIKNRSINRTQIRTDHILLQKKFRKTFLECIYQELHNRGIYKQFGEICEHFEQAFFNTMRQIMPVRDAIDLICNNY